MEKLNLKKLVDQRNKAQRALEMEIDKVLTEIGNDMNAVLLVESVAKRFLDDDKCKLGFNVEVSLKENKFLHVFKYEIK